MTDSLTYADAGVDIDKANKLVATIGEIAQKTAISGVMGEIGGFGGLFSPNLANLDRPVLVSSTDGVGTKLKIAFMLDKHDTIGIDLVAMCVNDIIVTGAEPLFFLDYYATAHLELDIATDVIKGIAEGCKQSGAALTGGETAEMPGMYSKGDYDLAGFCVGIVEKSKIIEPNRVQPGDVLIGLASTGPHSNGYSLIRKILEVSKADLQQTVGGQPLGEALLAPTRIYVKSLLALIEQVDVHALAHITGGGLPENLPRVLPEGTKAVIDATSWQRPALFDWLQQQGNVEESEMLRTFNCGVGMVVCVTESNADQAIELLNGNGEQAWRLGHIDAASGSSHVEVLS